MADSTFVTEVVVDASQATQGAATFEQAADRIQRASERATAAVDRLGEQVDRAGERMSRARQPAGDHETGLGRQADAARTAAAATEELARQHDAFIRSIQTGAISLRGSFPEIQAHMAAMQEARASIERVSRAAPLVPIVAAASAVPAMGAGSEDDIPTTVRRVMREFRPGAMPAEAHMAAQWASGGRVDSVVAANTARSHELEPAAVAGRVGGPVVPLAAAAPANDALALALANLNITLERLRMGMFAGPNVAPMEPGTRMIASPGAMRVMPGAGAAVEAAEVGAVGGVAAGAVSTTEAATLGAERAHAASLTGLATEERNFTAASEASTAAIVRQTAALNAASTSVRELTQAKQQAAARPAGTIVPDDPRIFNPDLTYRTGAAAPIAAEQTAVRAPPVAMTVLPEVGAEERAATAVEHVRATLQNQVGMWGRLKQELTSARDSIVGAFTGLGADEAGKLNLSASATENLTNKTKELGRASHESFFERKESREAEGLLAGSVLAGANAVDVMNFAVIALAHSFGLLKLQFILPFGALAAGFAELIKAANDADSAVHIFEATTKALGTSSQISSAQLQEQVEALKATGLSQDEALKSVQVLARSPGIAPGTFREIEMVSRNIAASFGGDTPGRIEQFVRALEGGVETTIKFDAQFVHLTDSEVKALIEMDRAGRTQEALGRAIDLLNERVRPASETFGRLGEATERLRVAWTELIDTMSKSPAVQGTIDAITRVLHAAATPMGQAVTGGAVSGVVAGAAIGGVVGSFGGPVGAFGGAAVGGVLGAAVAGLASAVMELTHQLQVEHQAQGQPGAASFTETLDRFLGQYVFGPLGINADYNKAQAEKAADAAEQLKRAGEKLDAAGDKLTGGAERVAQTPSEAATRPPELAAPTGPVVDRLMDALIRRETGNLPPQRQVSPAGALGPAQVMLGTAQQYAPGITPGELQYNAPLNRAIGERYLLDQLQAFGNIREALEAYTAGPRAVEQARAGVPSRGFAGAQAYAQDILTGAGLTGRENLQQIAGEQAAAERQVTTETKEQTIWRERAIELGQQSLRIAGQEGAQQELLRKELELENEVRARLPAGQQREEQIKQLRELFIASAQATANVEHEANQRRIQEGADVAAAAQRNTGAAIAAREAAAARELAIGKLGVDAQTALGDALAKSGQEAITAARLQQAAQEPVIRGEELLADAAGRTRNAYLQATIAVDARRAAQEANNQADAAAAAGLTELSARRRQEANDIEQGTVALRSQEEALRNAARLGQEAVRIREQTAGVALQIGLQGQPESVIRAQERLLQVQQEIAAGHQPAEMLTPEQAGVQTARERGLLQATEQAGRFDQALIEAQRNTTILNDLFVQIANTIDSALTARLREAFVHTPLEAAQHWKNFWKELGETARSTLADITSAIAKALVIQPLTGTIAQALGLGQVAQQTGTLQSLFGGAGGVGGVGGAGGLQSGALTINNPVISGNAGLFNAAGGGTVALTGPIALTSGGAGIFGVGGFINNIGGSLGFATTGAGLPISATVAGPTVPAELGGQVAGVSGGLFGATTLTQALGGAAAGFGAGSVLTSLIGRNTTGGFVGSAGGALLGTLLGAFLGGPIGAIAGGIGGGLFGGGAGSLFGGPPGGQSAGVLIGQAGQLLQSNTVGANAANIATSQQIGQQLQAFVSGLNQLTGPTGQPIGQITGGPFNVSVSNRGIAINSPGFGSQQFDQNAQQAVTQTELAIIHSLTNVSGVLQTVLQGITDPSQLQTAVQFADIYTKLNVTAQQLTASLQGNVNVIGPFQQALTQINSTFTQLTAQAQQFGVSTDPIRQGLAAITRQLNQDFGIALDEAFQTAIDGGNDFIKSLLDIHQAFVQTVSDAQAIAANNAAQGNAQAIEATNATATATRAATAAQAALAQQVITSPSNQVAAFAGGTSSTPPGWILVGEAGPEWLYQSGGATVLPHGQEPPGGATGPGFQTGTDIAQTAVGDISTLSGALGGPTLGGTAISALGLGETVSGVSDAIGGMLGFGIDALLGPIGILSAIASTIGLFFGPRPPNLATGGDLNLATGQVTDFKSSGVAANDQAVLQLGGGIAAFAQSLQQATGGTISGTINIQAGSRDGIKTGYSGPLGNINAAWGAVNQGDVQTALTNFELAIAHDITGVSASVQAALAQVTDPSQIGAVLQSAGVAWPPGTGAASSVPGPAPEGAAAEPVAAAPAPSTDAAAAPTDGGAAPVPAVATAAQNATAAATVAAAAPIVAEAASAPGANPVLGQSADLVTAVYDYLNSIELSPALANVLSTAAQVGTASGDIGQFVQGWIQAQGAPSAPGFATGATSTPPGWILVGEQGPEWLYHPTGGATVLPHGAQPPGGAPSTSGRSFAAGTDWGDYEISVPAGWSGIVTISPATAAAWTKLGATVSPIGGTSEPPGITGLQDYSVSVKLPAQTAIWGTSAQASAWGAAGAQITTLSAPQPVAAASSAGGGGAGGGATLSVAQAIQQAGATETAQAGPILAGLGIDQLTAVSQDLAQIAPEIADMANKLITSGAALPDVLTQGIQALTDPLQLAIEKEKALGVERVAVATQTGQDLVKVTQLNTASIVNAIISNLSNPQALLGLQFGGNLQALTALQAGPALAGLSADQLNALIANISNVAPDLANMARSFITAGVALPDTFTQQLEQIVNPVLLAIQQQAAQAQGRDIIAQTTGLYGPQIAALNTASITNAITQALSNPQTALALVARGTPAGVAALQAGPTLAGLGLDQLQAVLQDIGTTSPQLTAMINTLIASGKALPDALTTATEKITESGVAAVQQAAATAFETVQAAQAAGLNPQEAQAYAAAQQAQAVAQATGTQIPLGPLPDWVTQLTEAIVNPLALSVQKAEAAGIQQVQIAQATGADIVKVQQAVADQVQQIWYQATQQLTELRNNLLGGSLSGLIPASQVSAAVTQFNEVLKLVQGGNLSLINELASLGTGAVQAAQTAYGQGPVTASVRQQILAAISPFLVSPTGYPQTGADALTSTIAAALGTTGTTTAAGGSDLANNTSALTGLTTAVTDLTNAMTGNTAATSAATTTSAAATAAAVTNPVTGVSLTAAGITAVTPVKPATTAGLAAALTDVISGRATAADYTAVLQGYQAGIITPGTTPQYAQAIAEAQNWAAGGALAPGGPLAGALADAQAGHASSLDWQTIIAAVNADVISPTKTPQYATTINAARTIANAQATQLAATPNTQTAFATVYQGLPAFQAGTEATPPGWILVGERGPEWLHQPGGAQILPYGMMPPMPAPANMNARSFVSGTYPTWAPGAWQGAPYAGMTSESNTKEIVTELQALRKQLLGGQVQAAKDANQSNQHLGTISRTLGPGITAPVRRKVA